MRTASFSCWGGGSAQLPLLADPPPWSTTPSEADPLCRQTSVQADSPSEQMTDTCKNITLPTTSFADSNKLDWFNEMVFCIHTIG